MTATTAVLRVAHPCVCPGVKKLGWELVSLTSCRISVHQSSRKSNSRPFALTLRKAVRREPEGGATSVSHRVTVEINLRF